MTQNQNSLSDVDGTWVGDGSDGVLSVSLPEVSIESQGRGGPFNVMLDSHESSLTNNFFFEVGITKLQGSISIGVVRKDEFLPGYKIRGMFYNGNVTNGSAALLVAFGEYVKEGCTIGVLVSHEPSGTLDTVFYVNGCCLGSAFVLKGIQPGTIFRPCIHVTGKATVKYTVPPSPPLCKKRQAQHHADAYLGDWKLEKFLTGPELHEYSLPSDLDVIMTLRRGSRGITTYDFSLKVANTLATSIVVTGKAESFDSIEVGLPATTKMMPPSNLAGLERLVAESLPLLYKMIVGSEELIMTGANVELSAHRYSKKFKVLETYK